MREHQSDVFIFGATPCGISAAIAASRSNKSVMIAATKPFIGGLMASGLSCTDLRFRHAHGGIFNEFIEGVLHYYVSRYGAGSEQVRACNSGIWFEPHVAELVFEEMLTAHAAISLVRDVRLLNVKVDDGRVSSLLLEERTSRDKKLVGASVFIDATYEGDLAAASGASYVIGREDREKYFEPYAGKIFLKNPGLELMPGSSGEGDGLVQAYNFRLTLTNDASNRMPFPRPALYDRSAFVSIVDAALQGSISDIKDVIRLSPIPNGKFNGNNRPTMVSLDLPMANQKYPDGDEQSRNEIFDTYRSYTLGLLYFLQNDDALPSAFREQTAKWGFCKDEFRSSGGLSRELYVREARRIIGRKTFTSHDAFLSPGTERTPIHSDSIAVADYQVDSHIVQRRQPGWPQYEGHVYLRPISKPAQVPFGIIVPESIGSLLVPGAVSATHLGFSVLRMEPVWMALGQAAGTAAAMAIEQGLQVADIGMDALQEKLLSDGQVISYFHDVGLQDKLWEILNIPFEKAQLDHVGSIPVGNASCGILFFATRGFFKTYYARPADPVTRYEAVEWLDKFIQLAAFKSVVQDIVTEFADIDSCHLLAGPVRRLAAAGIATAWRQSNGFFGSAAMSRIDALEWINRVYVTHAGWKEIPGLENLLEAYSLQGWLPASWTAGDARAGYYCTREEFLDIVYYTYMHHQKTMITQKKVANETV